MDKKMAARIAMEHFQKSKGKMLSVEIKENDKNYILIAQFLHVRNKNGKEIKIRTIRKILIDKENGSII